jgi:SAM-dependent methyltransferase
MFAPIDDRLAEAVHGSAAKAVLDVGCGTGSTTMAIARQLGEEGHCVGIDISAPMIAAARARAGGENSRTDFIVADAESHAFEPARFDMIVSRFGMMFFGNPVAACANLRRAGTAGAGLRFAAWRGAEENPFMTVAERSAAPLIQNMPVRRADEPGQFAFGDRRRVTAILEASGWTAIEVRPLDLEVSMPEAELEGYFTRFGPLGRMLNTLDHDQRDRAIARVRAAFQEFVQGNEVRFTAACWDVSARGV